MKKRKKDNDLSGAIVQCLMLLRTIPEEQFPRIYWDLLDHDEWPEKIAEVLEFEYREEIRFRLLKFIETYCGDKALERYEWVEKQGRPNEAFDDWWDSAHSKPPKYDPLDDGKTMFLVGIAAVNVLIMLIQIVRVIVEKM